MREADWNVTRPAEMHTSSNTHDTSRDEFEGMDEYAGSSIFGRRDPGDAAEEEAHDRHTETNIFVQRDPNTLAEPIPVRLSDHRHESPFVAVGRKWSAAVREVKKRTQRDEW